MTDLEIKMIEVLSNLKNHYNAIGIKSEFESEGVRIDELMRLKDIISRAGLELTIKIGGAEAVTDMYNAKLLGASKIVAPMVESAYALKKYLLAAEKVFSEDQNVLFFVNIETIIAFSNLKEILNFNGNSVLSGVVFGRSDFIGSLGLEKNEVNSEKVMKYVADALTETKKREKQFFVGGNINASSLEFFRSLPKGLDGFETRKVIFEYKEGDNDSLKQVINKALDFELLWLENKKRYYEKISKEDVKRIEDLKVRKK